MDSIWVEKYRPQTVKDICGQTHIIEDFHSFVDKKNLPHLLFYGTQGTGKTTCSYAISRSVLGDSFGVNFMEMNASDERGIDAVRDKIKFFAKSQPMDSDFKIILLDECDALTDSAQNALRRIMEKYSENCRFILCCNNIEKMIAPIKSRCAMYNFLPLKWKDVTDRLYYICVMENIKYDANALVYIARQSFGDLRKAVNRLQTVASKGDITLDNIYSNTSEGTFIYIIETIKDCDRINMRAGIQTYLNEGGDIRDMILRMHNYLIENKIFPEEILGKLSTIFREADRDLLLGVSTQIEIDAMIYDVMKVVNNG